ncbi:homoserine kinase [Zhihengliuella salsuginis]|uniref:Homoserine kinase n=1 Tax=Zhihengliuella salsuginis TaxID=578222 RepID=A0ABQ3GIZ2_9MICC|nr:homoserine kinase [Zhihengliuella salsuginis]
MDRQSTGLDHRIAAGQRVTVTVPATSANLGPGFDCMGLALGLQDTLVVRTSDQPGARVSVSGEGAADLPTDESHLVARTILDRWRELGVEAAGLELEATNRIPHGRGLGSSAAAIVSALAAADALLPAEAAAKAGGRDGLFEAAALLEGHPDNVAPAVYGGLTLSYETAQATLIDGGEPHRPSTMHTVALALHQDIVPVVAIPDVELSTKAARGLLPQTVPHAHASANAARAGLLVTALTREPSLLHIGTEDFLHQSYRFAAMEESAGLIRSLRAQGYAAVVSGAGPTVLILAHGSEQAGSIAEAIERGVDEFGPWRVEIPGLDVSGAMVELH